MKDGFTLPWCVTCVHNTSISISPKGTDVLKYILPFSGLGHLKGLIYKIYVF